MTNRNVTFHFQTDEENSHFQKLRERENPSSDPQAEEKCGGSTREDRATIAIWDRYVELFMVTNLASCSYSEYVERINYAMGRGRHVVKYEINQMIRLSNFFARTPDYPIPTTRP